MSMPAIQEAQARVAFDAQQARFKARVEGDDYRLRAVCFALAPLKGRRILDLGCGKGRFAARLREEGADVIGLDLSRAMLAGAALAGVPRVRGTARRLPFAARQFDAVVAIEVIQHLARGALDQALGECARVLEPGGVVAIVDKNAAALDVQRPWLPSLAVKWLDEQRGRGMYDPGGPARERWFWPRGLERRLQRHFDSVRCQHLLSSREAQRPLFVRTAAVRQMALWTGKAPGGNHG
jgi:ubiquinone/menaquinone biosynthesis C-methylase UbiE